MSLPLFANCVLVAKIQKQDQQQRTGIYSLLLLGCPGALNAFLEFVLVSETSRTFVQL